MKKIEVRNLPTDGVDDAGDAVDESGVGHLPDGTPVSRLATAWFRTNLGCFRVNLTIVGPKAGEPKSYLTLSTAEAEHVLKGIADTVILLIKQARGYNPLKL